MVKDTTTSYHGMFLADGHPDFDLSMNNSVNIGKRFIHETNMVLKT